MKALVTGSHGFVGRHLRARLWAAGWDITSVDIADAYNPIDCRQFFTDHPNTHFDLVAHLAANVGGRAAIDRLPLFIAENLSLDEALFRWAVHAHPAKVVYFSSSAAYPIRWQQPGSTRRLAEDDINLDNVAQPDAMYGWAKLTGEQLAAAARQAGVNVLVVRPFSGYAEDQNPAYPFPAFLRRAAAREDPFAVWGDGRQVRDWVHIDDVISAVLAAVDSDHPGPLNIGTGVGTSMDSLVEMVCAAASYWPKLTHRVDAPTGVAYRVANPARLHTIYAPKISIEEGVMRTWAAWGR